LPAAQKIGPPRYQEVTSEGIPAVEFEGGQVRVIAGEHLGLQGPVREIIAQPLYMDVRLEPGGRFAMPIPAGHTTIAYLFEGPLFIDEEAITGGAPLEAVRMLVFRAGDEVSLRAPSDSSARFMLIAVRPFGEPIVTCGPFVMNTEAEIRQAFEDLRSGRFVAQG